MDLKQYIPQIIAGIFVLAGGGTLQYQTSGLQSNVENEITQKQSFATSNGEILSYLYVEISKLKDEISELKGEHREP